jgi:hypothetical protein
VTLYRNQSWSRRGNFGANRCRPLPARLELSGQHRHHRIMMQLVVIEVFVTECNRELVFADQVTTSCSIRSAPLVAEARRKSLHHPDRSDPSHPAEVRRHGR